jgi:hypothetical protein
MPAGVTYQFAPAQVYLSGGQTAGSTLTLYSTAGTPGGAYPLVITGTLGSAQRRAAFSLGTQVTGFQVTSATGSGIVHNTGQEVQVTHSVPAGNAPAYTTCDTADQDVTCRVISASSGTVTLGITASASAVHGNRVLRLNGGAATVHAAVGDVAPTSISVSPSEVTAGQWTQVAVTITGLNPSCGADSGCVPLASVTDSQGNQVTWATFNPAYSMIEIDPPAGSEGGTVDLWWGICDDFVDFDEDWAPCLFGPVPIPVPAPPPAPPAPPPPTLSVTSNGAAVAANSALWITATPAMPPLTAALLAAPGQPALSGTVSWQIVFNYAGAGDYAWPCWLPPTTLSASTPWDITGSMSGICGGSVTLTYTYGSFSGSFSFSVLGYNPYPTTVKNQLGTSPWFLQQLANHESGYAQFLANGQPNFGAPNGFGIMQLDPPSSTYQLWDWKQNVAEGISRLNTLNADSFWANQVQAWDAFNALYPSAYVYPPNDEQEGPCTFSMSPTGGNSHPFSDAVWIKRYNVGARRPEVQYIRFVTLGGSGSWQINQTPNYVQLVCQTAP